MKSKNSLSVAAGAVITIIWGLIARYVLYEKFWVDPPFDWIGALVYTLFIHLVVAWMWYKIVMLLFNLINKIYKSHIKWNLSANSRLVLASLWPITGPLAVLFLVIVAVLGILFKDSFADTK